MCMESPSVMHGSKLVHDHAGYTSGTVAWLSNWQCHLVMQPTSQSQETGALPVIRAATDPTLTGQGFKYFGPFYKGPINANIGNEGQILLISYLSTACCTCALNDSRRACTTIKQCMQ